MEFLKKKLETIKEYYGQIFLVAFFLLSFIFFNIFISSTLFIFKISITKTTAIISLILSIILNLHFLKQKELNINNKLTNVLVSIILPILIIIFSIFINGKVLDYTWDGNSYQKATIGMLAKGWNPLYEHIEDFEEKSDVKMLIRDESPVYINHYAKASNIFGANIYKLTGNIECGKSINTISIIMIFLFTVSFLFYKKKSILFSLAFSLCVATYSVICTQFLTNYIDLLVYVFLYLLIYSFLLLEEEKHIFNKNNVMLMYFMILTIAINIKVSLFGYCGIFCLGFYIWYIIRLIKEKIDKKFFWRFTLVSAISVLFGVFIIGLSVYPKNFIDHGHPFYPLMGEGKYDIMTQNQPNYFKEKSPIEKFVISTFSKVANIIESSNEVAEFKIPFTFDKDELYNVSACDARISGNGVFFGGILIISLIVILLCAKKLYKTNLNLFIFSMIPLAITIGMIFLLDEAWWARYFPQIYFVVLFAILILGAYSNSKLIKCLQYGLIILVLLNNGITFSKTVINAYQKNVLYNTEFAAIDNERYEEGTTIGINTASFHGAKYNILDRYNQYNIVFENENLEKYEEDKKLFGGYVKWRVIE